MVVEFPDGTTERFHEPPWLLKVTDPQQRYSKNKNEETRRVLAKTLKTFADLVLRYTIPEE